MWAVADGLDGMVHDAAPAPAVPGPDDLVPVEEMVRRSGAERPPHAFFGNFDERPVTWLDDDAHRPAGEPVQQGWYRFRPTTTLDDPWLDAGRLAIMVDTFQWPAAALGHAGDRLRHMAGRPPDGGPPKGSGQAAAVVRTRAAGTAAARSAMSAGSEVTTRPPPDGMQTATTCA